MADEFELDIEGLAEVSALLEALGRDVEEELTPIVDKALKYLWQQLPPYPPKPGPDAPSPLVTDKQRRWFFAALREGRITVPYKRRQADGLGGSISTEVRSAAGEITGLMGPSVPYAPHVVGLDEQAAIHQNRWWIFEEEIEKNLPGAIDIVEDGVRALLARR
jgi:hypothetical protein